MATEVLINTGQVAKVDGGPIFKDDSVEPVPARERFIEVEVYTTLPSLSKDPRASANYVITRVRHIVPLHQIVVQPVNDDQIKALKEYQLFHDQHSQTVKGKTRGPKVGWLELAMFPLAISLIGIAYMASPRLPERIPFSIKPQSVTKPNTPTPIVTPFPVK